MPRKNTVKVNYEKLNNAIDQHKKYRGNNTLFCLDMGFEKRTSWVSDLKRGRNLPSPEEAARMCILLETTPEEILLHEGETEKETAKCLEDIQRVKELVEELTAESAKKAPATEGEGISAERKALLDIVYSLTDEQCRKLLGVVLEAKKLM